MTDHLSLPRRSFLFWGAGAAAALIVRPDTASAAVDKYRTLTLHTRWSAEEFRGPYYEKGRYLPDALAEINHLFRDRHNQAVTKVDLRLLDLLSGFADKANYKNSLEIVCGYRSRSTNNELLHEGQRVAKDSLHIFRPRRRCALRQGIAAEAGPPDSPSPCRRAAIGLLPQAEVPASGCGAGQILVAAGAG